MRDRPERRVDFVVTEHPPALTPARRRDFEGIRRRLERLARVPVLSRRYVDVDDHDGACALVLSGSFAPWGAHDAGALARLGDVVLGFDGPVLGICAGMQLQAVWAGGSVGPAAAGPAVGWDPIEVLDDGELLRGLPRQAIAFAHHADEILELPDGFRVLARSRHCAVEAVHAPERSWWGTQFHPERFTREHPAGRRVLANFFELAVRGRTPGS
jgi:GMP synthase (glutamine-hydrolysing)